MNIIRSDSKRVQPGSRTRSLKNGQRKVCFCFLSERISCLENATHLLIPIRKLALMFAVLDSSFFDTLQLVHKNRTRAFSFEV